MEQIPFDWRKIRSVLVAVAAVLGLLLGVVNYVASQLPGGDVQALGVTNFDDLTLSGDLVVGDDATVSGDLQATGYFTAASVYPTISSAAYITADTSLLSSGTFDVVGATTFGGGFGSTGCSISAAGVLQCNGAATVGGAATITGAVTIHNTTEINGNLDVDSFSTAGNMDITTMNNTGANPVTVNDNLVVTGTLSVSGATFTGPIKYGSSASVVSGTLIAHGFSTTPTVILLTPVSTGGFTTTFPYIMASNATSFTVGIADDVSIATVYWAAGQ